MQAAGRAVRGAAAVAVAGVVCVAADDVRVCTAIAVVVVVVAGGVDDVATTAVAGAAAEDVAARCDGKV